MLAAWLLTRWTKPQGSWLGLLLFFTLGLFGGRPSFSQEFSQETAKSNSLQTPQMATLTVTESQARESLQALASLAMRYVPPVYRGDKDWGDTKKIWAGVHTELDGLKLKTHRKFRDVNHGRWIQYEIQFPNVAAPDAARTEIQSVVKTEEGGWIIGSTTVAPMNFTARVESWNLGVKLYRVTVTGHLRVGLQLTSNLRFLADYSEVIPAIVVDPKIEGAKVTLESFEVDRVSRMGGDAAEAWGEMMQAIIVERFIEGQNDKIVSKLNQAIDKHRKDLKLSPTSLWRW